MIVPVKLSKYIFVMGIFSLIACSKEIPLQTVDEVDLKRFVGKWYEIASFPQRFQKNCYNTSATYTLSDKGYIIIENRCNKGSIDGKESYIKGKAFADGIGSNARLKVQFFWPFKGKYWIIDLAEDYSYAVVGHPNRKYLWILSRTPHLDEELYLKLVDRIGENNFDISKLIKTKHG